VHDEKSIERYSQPVIRMRTTLTGSESIPLVPDSDGDFVKYDAHLAALGEAEKRGEQKGLEGYQAARLREEENFHRADAAEAKLKSLREALKVEVERLKETTKDASSDEECRRVEESIDRLQQLLDASEDTENPGFSDDDLVQCYRDMESAGTTQLSPKQREQIMSVAGHLEGYADGLDRIVRHELQLDITAFADKLREDAKRLKQSGGGEG